MVGGAVSGVRPLIARRSRRVKLHLWRTTLGRDRLGSLSRRPRCKIQEENYAKTRNSNRRLHVFCRVRV